ncbi:hypothetical protein L484_004012 [Morus notabilis]|uniref:Retrovirus-related Pol polyprotein from transposon TNT 1-94 n=1 Tax=Morus notabilis TaxID=981085 RepID=W9QQX3_9ROSA|nr:hypothetical protein L484_004012 [Morus notabilis]
MAEEVVNPIVPEEVVNPAVPVVIHTPTQLVFFNPAAQLPLKLTPNNYPAWRAQVLSLLQGYNLLGYVNGNIPQPPAIVTQNGVESPNPNHTHWVQQDQLLLHSIFASLPEFKEISGAVRAREQPISFEALHDKLVEYEDFLKRNSPQGGLTPIIANFRQKNSSGHNKLGKSQYHHNRNNSVQQNQSQQAWSQSQQANQSRNRNPNLVCQFCEKRGHNARECYTAKCLMGLPVPPKANHATINNCGTTSNWLLDSGASHHITSDMNNLTLREPYEGLDDIVIGDGTGDLTTGELLARGRSKNNVYESSSVREIQPVEKQAHVSVKTTLDRWHDRLGHPSSKVLSHIVSSNKLPVIRVNVTKVTSCLLVSLLYRAVVH